MGDIEVCAYTAHAAIMISIHEISYLMVYSQLIKLIDQLK